MFDWEDETQENHLNDDLARFEQQYTANDFGFYDSDCLEGIIDHYLINGYYSKAEAAAEVGIQQYPFYTLFAIRKAQAMSGLGKLKEALNILEPIERVDPTSLDMLLTKATIFSQLRDNKNAIKYFRTALEHAEEEDRDEIYLDLANELEQVRDFKGAVDVLESAMITNPKNEGALYELAFCLDQLGDMERAIQSYHRFLDDNPYSFTAWYNLGNTFSKCERFTEAITAYEYSLVINERFSPSYFNMGNAQLTLESYNESIESFEKCLEIDGDDPLTFCYLGEAYEHLENLDKAWEFYQKSLNLAPTLAEAWLGLGIVKDLQGKPNESLHYIERAIEIEPSMDGYFHVYAGALENAGFLEKAEEAYLKCLELDPGNEDAFFDYVDYLMDYRTTEARPYVEDFLSKNNYFFAILPIIYLNAISGRLNDAKLLLVESLFANREKTLDIFERYPDLNDIPEIVELTKK
jgi:tetratricopeptide (TPR) repeat protein